MDDIIVSNFDIFHQLLFEIFVRKRGSVKFPLRTDPGVCSWVLHLSESALFCNPF
jgi:hypothetical protein